MTVRVDVQIATAAHGVPNIDEISVWVSRAIETAEYPEEKEVTVRVVDVDEIQMLNREFRQHDAATNVLSFPAAPIDGLPDELDSSLGDVVVCAAIVAEEAGQQSKAVADHWAHMLVHGTLHLMGYDHLNDKQATDMERLETRILLAHGVGDPYGESPQET